jgi:CRP/FNR family transcriptional regulator
MLSNEQKLIIEENKVRVNYNKGETICKQGSQATHVLFLEEGLVKVYLEGKSKNLILTIIPAGQMIGLPSIFDGNNTFVYSVTTYVDSVVHMINIDVIKQMILDNAKFAGHVISILNETTAQTYGRFYCLMQKQLHGRMADILLCLSNRIFKSKSFQLPLSRNDLGELTGMSTESVIRIFKDFKDEKLISVNLKSVEILDEERLLMLSEKG